MGSLALPSSGRVYTDTDILIYSVETHAVYWSLLQPLWHAARAGIVSIVSSEFALMETLIGPLRSGDTVLLLAYEQVFQASEMHLLPISQSVLREAAPRMPPGRSGSNAAVQLLDPHECGHYKMDGFPLIHQVGFTADLLSF